MASVRTIKSHIQPQDPVSNGKKKKSGGILGPIFFSAIAILVVMFTMGSFPQADNFISNTNNELQSYNNQIVAAIIANIPTAIATIAALIVAVIIFRACINRRPSARA